MADETAAPMGLFRSDRGTGAPVLFLHGLGGDHSVWDGLAPSLGAMRAIAPDLRGHGRSVPAPDGPISFERMSSDLLGLLDELGVASAHLVGLSAGAFLALQLTLDHPDRVRSLVSIGGAAQCDRHTREIGDRWARIFRDEGFDAYVLRLVKDLYAPDWAEAHLEIIDLLRTQAGEMDFGPMLRWSDSIRSFDVRARIARIRRPTLVLHGMDDQVVDVAHARVLRQTIPGAVMRLFPRTGHLVPIEQPEATAAAIAPWIAGLEADAPRAGTPPLG